MIDPQVVLQTLWRKAAGAAEPVTIPCRDAKEAKRRRFALYNAVKAVKRTPTLDPELAEAAKTCSIWFKDAKTLMLGRKAADDDLVALAESLGADLQAASAAPRDLKEKAELDAQAAFMERMQQSGLVEEKLPIPAPPQIPQLQPMMEPQPPENAPAKRVRAVDLYFGAKKGD